MHEIPQWIINIVANDDMDCDTCKKQFTPKDIVAIGIQESTQPPHKDTLTIGLFCRKCNELAIFEIKQMNLVDLAFTILEGESSESIKKTEAALDDQIAKKKAEESDKSRAGKDPTRSRGKKPISRSKITAQDARKASIILRRCKSHDDFLALMGMSPNEIESYKLPLKGRGERDKEHGK